MSQTIIIYAEHTTMAGRRWWGEIEDRPEDDTFVYAPDSIEGVRDFLAGFAAQSSVFSARCASTIADAYRDDLIEAVDGWLAEAGATEDEREWVAEGVDELDLMRQAKWDPSEALRLVRLDMDHEAGESTR